MSYEWKELFENLEQLQFIHYYHDVIAPTSSNPGPCLVLGQQDLGLRGRSDFVVGNGSASFMAALAFISL